MKVTLVYASLLSNLESKIKFDNFLLYLLLVVIIIPSLGSLRCPFMQLLVFSFNDIWFGSPVAIL